MQNLTIDKKSPIYEVHKQVSDLIGEKIALSFEPIVSGDSVVLVCSMTGTETRNKGFSFSFLMDDIDNRTLKLNAYMDALDVFGVNLVIQGDKPLPTTQPCPEETKKKGLISSLNIPDKLKSKLKQAVKEFQIDSARLKELILTYGGESNYKYRTLQDIAEEGNIRSFIDFIYDQCESSDEEE